MRGGQNGGGTGPRPGDGAGHSLVPLLAFPLDYLPLLYLAKEFPPDRQVNVPQQVAMDINACM